MKKKIILFAFIILSLFNTAVYSNVIFECVYESLKDRIEHSLGLDFKASSYMPELIKNTAMGKPEATVERIMDDYSSKAFVESMSPDSMAKDVALKLFERLLPGGGVISVLTAMSEAANDYTRYMLDFYKQKHMQNFYDRVIKPSKTVAQLKSNYRTFIEEYVNTGMSDTNVLYAERKELENKFHEAFLKAVVPIRKRELAEKNKKLVIKSISRRLKRMAAKERKSVKWAYYALLKAKMPATKKNIRAYIKDGKFRRKVGSKIAEIIKKAKEKKKKAEKSKQKIIVAVVPPKASENAIASLTDMETNAMITDARITDYTSFIMAYRNWAEKHMAGEIDCDAFEAATAEITGTVGKLYDTCYNESENISNNEDDVFKLKRECSKGYEKFEKEKKRMDKKVEENRKKIISQLKEMESIQIPDPRKEYQKIISKYGYDNPFGENLRKLEEIISYCSVDNGFAGDEYIKRCEKTASSLTGIVKVIESDSRKIEELADDYSRSMNEAIDKYNELYEKNEKFLCDFYPKDFSKKLLEIPTLLRNAASRKISLASELKEKISKTRKIIPVLRFHLRKNKDYLKTAGNLRKKVFELNFAEIDGKKTKITKFWDEKYDSIYSRIRAIKKRSAVLDISNNADLSGDNAKVYIDGKSYSPYKIPVDYRYSLDEHQEKLEDYREYILPVEKMNLPSRISKIKQYIKQENGAYNALDEKYISQESKNLHEDFKTYEFRSGEAYSLLHRFQSYLEAYNDFKSALELYGKRINQAREKEKWLISVFKKCQVKNCGGYYETFEDSGEKRFDKDWIKAYNFLRRKNWDISDEVFAEKRKAQEVQFNFHIEYINKSKEKEAKERKKKEIELIKKLYSDFKSAYESKNLPRFMRLISSGWETADGESDISDLRDNLRNNFRLYDVIRCNISNLNIKFHQSNGMVSVYEVNYDIYIQGKIYSRHITHEEKSSVSERVEVSINNKRAKIISTWGGNYWYIK